MITCGEIIEETKTVSTNFTEKSATCKTKKYLYFTCLLIDYYNFINSCSYLLLPDKMQSQAKAFLAMLCHKEQIR